MLIYKLQNNGAFSFSERVLADFVLGSLPDVCNMSARQVAKEAFVSPATVIRFSKKLGFEGFEQFKRQLYAEWTGNKGKEIQIDADFPFEKDMPYDVFMENDRALQKNRCVYLHENHFNIILSYTGESRRTLEIARFLHQNKRETLSITNEMDNSLMKHTTYHLSIAKLEGQILSGGISNMCSSISFTFLLDLIYAGVFQKDYEVNLKTIHDGVTRQSLFMPR